MGNTRAGSSDERDRSTVERLASGLVGSDVVKHATKNAMAARERAVEMQELTLSALNLPSAAVIDRLTRRVRSVALRLESIEDALDRLEDRLEESATPDADLGKRLAAIEKRLAALSRDGSA